MTDFELAACSLNELTVMLRDGKVSSREITEATLSALDHQDSKLNLIAGVDPEEALRQADAADARRASGDALGLLHGVPLAHKDMFYRKGRVSGGGSRILGEHPATVTATVLRRLDAAGALDVARLNMVEFAYGLTGHNEITGDVRNPWNPDHITGGSSSGPAAAVAAKCLAGALGSDTGGSIRFPASCCGLVGMKPTYGRVSRFGAMPLSHTLDHIGPLTRTVRDCALITEVISGQDAQDPTSSHLPVPSMVPEHHEVAGMKIGVPTNYFVEVLDPEVQECWNQDLKRFQALGCELVELVLPESFFASNAMVNLVGAAESSAHHARWLRERPQDYGAQTLRRLQSGLQVSAVDYLEGLNLRQVVLQDFLEQGMARVDALHVPVVPIPVPTLAESDIQANPGFIEYLSLLGHCTRPFDFLGVPALSIPAGQTSNGLPCGMQLVGRPFSEPLLFRLGLAHEEALA